ncbi:esterase 3-like protein [Leptotrombidium deliense]|uniref:Esterase 3-like protein n=1 Tax=Leptotrombidium deliense TaxID=299467 RepID=A0A443SDG2_9ACAR|nr:esterase 3-like protein [Leptotrombidium deliense]
MRSTRSLVRVPFWPVYGEAFIPKMNQDLWKEKKFKHNSELLIGTLPNDAFAAFKLKSNDLNLNNRIDVVLTDIMKNFMPSQVSINADDIVKMYTSDIDLSNEQQSKKALIHSLNNVLFDCPALMLAQQYSSANDVYYYLFNYHAVDAKVALSEVCELVTPCHAFDEFFVFGFVSEENKLVSREWMQIIAQFVKTGTVPWPKYQKTSKDELIQFYFTFNGGNSSFVDIGYKTSVCNILNPFLFTKL